MENKGLVEVIKKIGQDIITQDNRITADPFFAVQQKVKDYGYDDSYSDNWDWISEQSGEMVYNKRLTARLDRILQHGDSDCLKDKYYPVYFNERWEFVTGCFTEKGCEDYLKLDRHNLNEEVRIYAYGSYRNYEHQIIREFLIKLAKGEIKWDS